LLAWVCRVTDGSGITMSMTNLRAWRWPALLGIAVVALALFRYEHDLQYRTREAGDLLGSLQVASLGGSPYTLTAHGRPMLINVFATWCGPCRAEAPDLAYAAARLRASGIDVVGIDQQESGGQVQAFARAFGLRYPLYVDTSGITHAVLGARVIPMTVYVDASGIIRWEHEGPIDAKALLALPSERAHDAS